MLALAYSPNSRYLAVSAGVDLSDQAGPPGRLGGGAALPDPRKRSRGEVHVWDLFTNQEQEKVPKELSGPVRALAFNPRGENLTAATSEFNFNGQRHRLITWNVQFGWPQQPSQVHLNQQVRGLQWTPSGKLLALERDGTLHEVDSNGQLNTIRRTALSDPWLELGELPGALADRQPSLLTLTNGPEGLFVAELATDGLTIRLLNVGRNYQETDLRGHSDRVTGLAGSATTNRLASVSLDGTLRIWDAPSGKEKFKLEGHKGAIKSVVFSHDGKRVMTCGADNTIRVWDPQTGVELLTLTLGETNLSGLALRADGRQLAVAHGQEVTLLGGLR